MKFTSLIIALVISAGNVYSDCPELNNESKWAMLLQCYQVDKLSDVDKFTKLSEIRKLKEELKYMSKNEKDNAIKKIIPHQISAKGDLNAICRYSSKFSKNKELNLKQLLILDNVVPGKGIKGEVKNGFCEYKYDNKKGIYLHTVENPYFISNVE